MIQIRKECDTTAKLPSNDYAYKLTGKDESYLEKKPRGRSPLSNEKLTLDITLNMPAS